MDMETTEKNAPPPPCSPASLLRKHWVVYLLYLVLTVIIAWPSIVHPPRALFGRHGDALLTIFWLWWFKTAWLRGLPADPNPMVAAPFGADWGGVIERGTVWPGALLSALVNETFAFNVLVLVSFPLAGIAAYHLTLRLTRSRAASAVAGLIYAFCPYHLWKAWAWIPLSNIQWMPLYVLALLDLRGRRRLKDALLAGFWFGVNLITSYIYGFMLGALTLLYLLYALAYAYVTCGRITVDRRTLLLVATVVAVAGALVLPVAAPILVRSLAASPETAPYKYAWPFEHLYGLLAVPADYFLPSDSSWLHPLFAAVDPPTARGDYTNGLFIGYGALALAGVAAWGWRRERRRRALEESDLFALPFFGLLFFVAMVVSMLPPTVQLGLPGLGPVVLKGPGYFTYRLAPWFREFARFGVLVMLAAAVLAGWGAAYVLRWLAQRERRRVAFLSLLALVLAFDYGFDSAAVGPVLDTGNVPEVYRWLAQQPGAPIVAEYPVPRSTQVSPNYLFYVTVHGKRLVGGHGFSHRGDLLAPALWDLSDCQTPGVLRALGVEYVIVHHAFPGFEQWYAALPAPFVAAGDFELVREFDTATVLRVRAEPVSVIAAPGEGMTLSPDQTLQVAWWWLADVGRINLINATDTPVAAELRLTVTGYGGATGLDVGLADGTPVSLAWLDAQAGRLAVGPLELPPGHLWEQAVPEMVTLVLRVTSAGEHAGIGLRDFEIVER